MAIRRETGVYKRTLKSGAKDQFWSVDMQYRGQRISRRSPYTSKKDALIWVQDLKTQIDRDLEMGLRVSRSARGRLNIGQALALYWTERLQFSASAKNEKYVLPRLGQVLGTETPLEEMSTADIARYVAQRLTDQAAATTIIREIAIIRAMHNHATEVWEYPTKRVAWRRVLPKVPVRIPRDLSPVDVKLLIANATPRLALAIEFACLTGLRFSELYKLAWDHLDFNRRTVRLVGKGNKEAVLPLSSAAISLLSSMQPATSYRVFDGRNFRREWNATRQKAGLHGTTFHHLRHAFATWLDGMGAPIQAIQRGLRHSNISTSLIYAHAGNAALLPYLEQLSDRLSNSSDSSSK